MTPAARELKEILTKPFTAYGSIVTADDKLSELIHNTYKDRIDEVVQRFNLSGDVNDNTVFEFISAAVFVFAHFITRHHTAMLLEQFPMELISIGDSFRTVKYEEIGNHKEVRKHVYMAIYVRLAETQDDWDPLHGIEMIYHKLIIPSAFRYAETLELHSIAREAKTIFYHFNPIDIKTQIH